MVAHYPAYGTKWTNGSSMCFEVDRPLTRTWKLAPHTSRTLAPRGHDGLGSYFPSTLRHCPSEHTHGTHIFRPPIHCIQICWSLLPWKKSLQLLREMPPKDCFHIHKKNPAPGISWVSLRAPSTLLCSLAQRSSSRHLFKDTALLSLARVVTRTPRPRWPSLQPIAQKTQNWQIATEPPATHWASSLGQATKLQNTQQAAM